jgi:hypothetical protein
MKDKLDNILQDWAARMAPTKEHLKDLTTRVTGEVARRRYLAHTEDRPVAVVQFWSKLAYAGLGAAVTLVIALVCFHSFLTVTGPSPNSAPASSFAFISREQAKAGNRLFREMERLFPNNLRWISESNGDVGMGVESVQGGILQDSPEIFVRLTVVARKEGEKSWKPIWKTDVLLRGEELVEVVPNREKDNRLALWVYPLAGGKVAIDSSLALDMPMRLASRINTIVEQGEPAEIMSLRADNMEYRVFQTVKVLSAG